MTIFRKAAGLSLVAIAAVSAAPARCELVLSELVIELQPGKQVRDDVEVWNNSPERSFVAVEPREILDPSLPTEAVHKDPDPEKLGLLVSPARMILEPGQRKMLRIATISPATNREHVYRVTVKPVVGGVQSDDSGLKIVVGYDVLVLVRPAKAEANVTARRSGRTLSFTNAGNVSVEVVDGRQCATGGNHCTDLPGKRLYPGASWTVQLPSDLPAEYVLKSPGRTDRRIY
ncbi:MAG: molecular chaperone [Sphingomicrobium sp.]